MRWCTFDTDPSGKPFTGRFEIDWDTYDYRKYREPVNGLRIYEAGFIELRSNYDGNPDGRFSIRAQYGIDLRQLSEITGVELLNPNTGECVPKTWIDNTGPYYVDDKWGRVYSFGSHWRNRSTIKWLHPDAQPVCGATFEYFQPDQQRLKDMREKIAPLLDLGRTLNSVAGVTRLDRVKTTDVFRALADGLTYDLTAQTTQGAARYLDRRRAEVDNDLKRFCRDRIEVPFLDMRSK